MTNHREKEKPERLSPVEDAEQWFKFADSDFTTATLGVEQEDPPISTICYLCQQAAEKYLKGYLISKGWSLKKVHDLSALLAECMVYDQDFETLKQAVITLNPYSVEARYPGDRFIHFFPDDAKTVVEQAQQIIDL
jgi:HEPN domain-containing protein